MVDQRNFNVKTLKAKVSLQVICKLIDMDREREETILSLDIVTK